MSMSWFKTITLKKKVRVGCLVLTWKKYKQAHKETKKKTESNKQVNFHIYNIKVYIITNYQLTDEFSLCMYVLNERNLTRSLIRIVIKAKRNSLYPTPLYIIVWHYYYYYYSALVRTNSNDLPQITLFTCKQ